MSFAGGVIRNPRSQRNLASPIADATLPEGVTVAMPASPAALAETLKLFAATGVRDILIDGGDGTLREVMSALPEAYGEALPSLALCASGNTNLAAADVGSFARGPDAVRQWADTVKGSKPSRASARRPIAVHWPDGIRAPVFGFFVGCANYSRAVAMAAGSLKKRGLLHGWAVAGTIASAAAQIVAGSKQSVWQRGSAIALGIDGAASESAQRFVVLATTLDKLVLGLWPFWSAPGAQGALQWLDITAPAPRFGLALPALLRGRPKPWMLASGAYRSGRAGSLLLQMGEPLVIDGETFAPDGSGQLRLEAGPSLRFHAPA